LPGGYSIKIISLLNCYSQGGSTHYAARRMTKGLCSTSAVFRHPDCYCPSQLSGAQPTRFGHRLN